MVSLPRPGRALLLVGALLFGVGTTLPTAQHAVEPHTAGPRITWYFVHPSVEVHAPAEVVLCGSDVPRGANTVLQEQVGTGHVWHTLAGFGIVGNKCGSRRFSEPFSGRFAFHVRLYLSNRLRFQSAIQILTAYQHVSLNLLCSEAQGGFAPDNNECTGVSTVEIGGTLFTSLFLVSQPATPPNYDNLLQFGNTSCSTLTLQVGVLGGASGTTEIVQASSVPQQATVPAGSVESMTFSLDGGPWTLDTWGATGYESIYFNGYANCWTNSGLP